MKSLRLNKSRRITLVAAIILAAAFIFLLAFGLYPKIRRETVIKGLTEYTLSELSSGSISEHSFKCTMCGFDSLFFFIMKGDATDLSVSVTNTDSDTLYINDLRIPADICSCEGNGTVIKLQRPEGTRFEPGHYSVMLTNNSSSPIELVLEKDSKDLAVRLFVKTSMGYFVFAVVCAMLFAFAVIAVSMYLKAGTALSLKPEQLFLAAAIPLCISCIFLIPPWSTGDSEAHYLACYRLSNIFLGQSGNSEWMGRTDDVNFFKNIWWNFTTPRSGAYEIIRSNLDLHVSNKNLIPMTATSEKMNFYSVFCYIPQTLALVIGRLIGFGPVLNCYFAKLLTAFFYVTLGYRAVKKAPYYKEIIAFCAVLPSSLFTSGAFSYDPMVIITTLNFISSVLLLKENPDNRKALIITSIWAFLLGAVKGGGYLILLPILFIVPAGKNDFKHIGKFLPMVFGLLSVAIFDMFLPSQSLYQFGSKGNGFMSASFALENPLTYLVMTLKSYIRFAAELTEDLFGSKLCWGEKTLPFGFSIAMLLILLIFAASDDRIDKLRLRDILILSVTVLIALLTTPMMLLSWTPEGSDVILGIQGHYFLPVLPLFAIVCAKLLRKLARKTGIGKFKVTEMLKAAAYPAAAMMLVFAFYCIMRLYLTR